MPCLCHQAGVVQPLMTIVFGNLTTSFTGFANALALGQDPAPFRDSLFSQVNQSSLYLVYIGIGTFCTTYIQIFTWTWTGERITRRIREAYLRNVLRQNIGFFDKLGPGEVTTRISSDLNMIQSGISDKVPMGEPCTSASYAVPLADIRLKVCCSAQPPNTYRSSSPVSPSHMSRIGGLRWSSA